MNHDVEDETELVAELRSLDAVLKVCRPLNEISNSMYFFSKNIEINRSDTCVMIIDQGMQEITLEVYPDVEKADAVNRYNTLELTETEEGSIYLLARAASVDALLRAYPNYFSNISDFVLRLKKLLPDGENAR